MEELNEMERLKPETFAKEMQGDPSSGSLETISRDDFRAWRIEEGQAVLFGRDGEVLHRWKEKAEDAFTVLRWRREQVKDKDAEIERLKKAMKDIRDAWYCQLDYVYESGDDAFCFSCGIEPICKALS